MRRLWTLLGDARDLRFLLAANLVSLTGEWMLRTGVAYQIYVLTGSTLASAAAVLASLVPTIVLGSVAGVFADRWDRRRTMVATDLLMAAALLPLIAVHDAGRAWIVYLVLALQSCLAPFFASAEAALLPRVAPQDQLVTVNSLNAQVRDVARLIGAALGGVVAAAGGIGLLGALNAVTFLLSACLLLAIRVRRRPAAGEATHPLREWAEGLRIASSSPTLRVWLAFGLITGIGEAVIGTLMAPFVRDVLGGSARAYGMIMAAQAIGGLGGGLIVTLIGHRFTPRAMFGCGAVAFGLLDLALFTYPLLRPVLWPAVALIVLVGLPAAFMTAGAMTVFQEATEDEHRGRVWGATVAVDGAAMLLGTVAAGTLAGHLGILPVIAAQGVAYSLAGAMVLAALRPPAPDRVHALRR
ncbi:MFS transporter [Actinoplanes sp. NPDC051346]|uniref:MFS transporter n=1 Tax=Actinoplanes sp. NPDC051346 TaxID=3155048 RepID=UPI003437823E